MPSIILLLGLAVRVVALDAVAIQSFDRSFPFLPRHAPADLKLRPERVLVENEECPICARVGTSFLPLAIPSPDSPYLNEVTCLYYSSNEYYKGFISTQALNSCAAHQDYFEEVCCEVFGSAPPL